MTQDDLIAAVAATAGHFRLESGHHGDLWLNLDRLLGRPAALRPFTAELGRRLAAYNIQAVCGPLTGGAFLAQQAAADLDVAFVYAERFAHPERTGLFPVEYRIPAALRAAVAGQRVAVLDDAINAGSAVRATLADLAACGAQVGAIGALFVLGYAAADLAAETGLPLEHLAHVPSHRWVPAACPLCATGVPLQDPALPSR
ncbi:MAG TPA: phosphoribosyltransferase family protein [Ktedonobacterales bacterium]|nr:phosphoribosyltransferase family protein [Ktedonobacterales bacterium]